jgi:3-deoxy-manno-octulosonate cytidylyltransferase (CMP-KDO synthetase)
LYAFRSDILKQITSLPVSSLEKAESLEQLRWLENGYQIKVAITNTESICIETPEDINRAIEYMKHLA